MGRIQTGVDKLVALLKAKQRVSVDDAAKELGVSKTIIQEWADFLEEEGMLELKYSLSKTYLVDRTLTKSELGQKEKQFTAQRETFISKVDEAIAQLEQETTGFESFKKEFQGMKQELGSSLSTVQKELEDLKNYEQMKKQVSTELEKERASFLAREKETESRLQHEYAQYHDVIAAITDEEKKLALHKASVHELLASEETVGKKLDAYTKLLANLHGRITEETAALGLDENTLAKLTKNAEGLRKELAGLESSNLKPLEQERAAHDAKLKKIEEQILAKAGSLDKSTKVPQQQALVARKKLEEFFKRKKDIEALIEQVDKDKLALLAELKELQQRSEAYRLGKKNVGIEELQGKIAAIEEKKKGLRAHIASFLKVLKNK